MEPRKEWKGKRNYNCKFQHLKKQLGVVEKSLKASRTGSTFWQKSNFFIMIAGVWEGPCVKVVCFNIWKQKLAEIVNGFVWFWKNVVGSS